MSSLPPLLFTFRPRTGGERFNWRLVGGVDADAVMREGAAEALEAILPHITYAVLSKEEVEMTDTQQVCI